MMGTSELRIDWMIFRIDESRPPGVSIVIKTAAASCSSAASIELAR